MYTRSGCYGRLATMSTADPGSGLYDSVIRGGTVVTGGIEVRFGGPRKAYWPWNPGRHYH